ncbi:MAG: protein kinase [Planctomycetaceae bacterium]|nr:protein kinase [Planctomycetaceae bacterium]
MTDRTDEEHPVDRMAEDFARRYRQGERPAVSEYVRQQPELAEEIRSALSAVVMLENIKTDNAAAREAIAPERFGDFRVVREIGRGGMGIVYEAEQESLGRRVALKVLPNGSLVDAKHVSRFQREAQAAARLHHSHIVPVFGVGHQNDTHYYVMQLISGRGLDRVLEELCSEHTDQKTEPLDIDRTVLWNDSGKETNSSWIAPTTSDSDAAVRPAEPLADVTELHGRGVFWPAVARIIADAADALHYAHSQGVLHRDIKPANLLLDREGCVWIADFGLAKLAGQENVTHAGDIVGTLRYMPPEQFQGRPEARSDVYSLGLTLYELCTRRPAFDATERGPLVKQILHDEPPRPRRIDPLVPRDLETIILKAITREPAGRYQTASALADDLRLFLEDRPISARPISAFERLWRWSRRNPALATASSLALFGLVLATVIGWIGYVSTRQALAEKQIEHSKVLTAKATTEATLDVALAGFERVFVGLAATANGLPLDGGDGGDGGDDGGEPFGLSVVSEQDARVLQELLSFYDRFTELNRDNPKLRRELAQANRRVGDIQQRLGRLSVAEATFRRTLESLDTPTQEAEVRSQLGQTLLLLSRVDDARSEFDRTVALRRQLAEQAADDPQTKFELARALQQLGGMSRLPRVVQQGEASLREAAQLLEILVSSHPARTDFRLILARTLRGLSPLLMRAGQREESLTANTRALALLDALHEESPSNPEFLAELAEANLSLDLDSPAIRLPLARRRFEQAVRFADELYRQQSHVPAYAVLRSRAAARLGDVLQRQGEASSSLRELDTARDILNDLIRRFPSIPLYRLLRGEASLTAGTSYRDDRQLSQSRAALEAGISDLESYLTAVPRSSAARNRRMQAYRNLATTLTLLGEPQLAAEAISKAAP